LKGHSNMPSWLYMLTTGNFVTNKILFATFQKSHWLKFARCLCNAESRCSSTTDFWNGQSQYHTTSKTTVCCPRGTYLARVLSCTIVTYQIRQEGGNLPSWSKKQRAFSLKLFLVALSVSFNWFSTKETTFCRKASNFAYFSHLYFQQISAIQTGLSEQRASLCYTNRRVFKNETRTRPPTCEMMPWTLNVYEIKGDKGFLAFCRSKSS